MLRFLPQQAELVYSVTVKCNEKSAWHKSFTLVMGPDEPVNAVLGEHSSMSITVLDKEATGSLVLPSPPKVVSLADYDQLKVVLLRLPDPLIINPHRSPIKPPSPEPATRLFASRHAIRNRQIQVKWSHFVLRQALTTIWFDMRGKSHSPTVQTLSAFKMSHRGRIPTQKCWTQFTSR